MSRKKILVIIPIIILVAIAGVVLANFLISRNAPVAIKVVSISHKNSYYVGEQFDATNLAVALYSKSGQLRYLNEDEYTVENFDSSKAGEVELTVKYGELTTQFTVTVKDLPAEIPHYVSLEMYSLPVKLQYKVGEQLDVSGGILKINYSDGTYDIVELLPLMTYGFSSEEVGNVTVYVSYLGMETSFQVTVV